MEVGELCGIVNDDSSARDAVTLNTCIGNTDRDNLDARAAQFVSYVLANGTPTNEYDP